jgi:2'-5' RNA ligase
LFRGNSRLLLGFNTFLPKQYHITLTSTGALNIPDRQESPSASASASFETVAVTTSASGYLNVADSGTGNIDSQQQQQQQLLQQQLQQQQQQQQQQQVMPASTTAYLAKLQELMIEGMMAHGLELDIKVTRKYFHLEKWLIVQLYVILHTVDCAALTVHLHNCYLMPDIRSVCAV